MWSVITDLVCLTDFFKKSALKWSSFCLKSLVFGLKVCSLRAMLAIFPVKYSVVRYMDSPLSIIKLNQWEWFNSIIISMWNQISQSASPLISCLILHLYFLVQLDLLRSVFSRKIWENWSAKVFFGNFLVFFESFFFQNLVFFSYHPHCIRHVNKNISTSFVACRG